MFAAERLRAFLNALCAEGISTRNSPSHAAKSLSPGALLPRHRPNWMAARLFRIDAPKVAGVLGCVGRIGRAESGVLALEFETERGYICALPTPLAYLALVESKRMLLTSPGQQSAAAADAGSPVSFELNQSARRQAISMAATGRSGWRRWWPKWNRGSRHSG